VHHDRRQKELGLNHHHANRRGGVPELERLERVRECVAATRASVDENRRLSQIRDELLPLVMSGKVCVRDAERIVSEVL
jgi:hypothetical protein